ncbi:MAG TPA: hypothetical protein VL137_13055 [Polyangiaceae bacterium]|nr:hypothetical protein [Polyangiaceae bacterium]
MRWPGVLALGVVGGGSLLCAVASAQFPMIAPAASGTAAPASDAAPAASTTEPTAAASSAAASPAAAATGTQCFPSCRPGYVCGPQGTCVSACNPACLSGFECSADLHCVALASTPASTPASASTQAKPADEDYYQPTADQDRPYYHDRLYLRLALGFGGVAGKFRKFSDGSDPFQFFGGGGALEIALGGTVARGLVLGGGIYSTSSIDLRRKDAGQTRAVGSGSFTLLGPFVDWYFKPDGGFHLQGAVGLTSSTVRGSGRYIEIQDFDGVGAGVMVGFGYEAYVSKMWSLGGLFRLQAGSAKLEGVDTNSKFEAGFISPALLFDATFH